MSKKKPSPEIQAIISATDANQFATTVTLVEKFLAENPDSPKAWLDLGHASGQLCRYEQAFAAFDKAVDLIGESDAGPVFAQMGHLHRTQGDFGQAERCYQKQIEGTPSDTTGYIFLANLQLRTGRLEEAEKTLESALDGETGVMEEVHYTLGLVYRGLGKLSPALEQFQKAVQIDADYALAKVALKDVKAAVNL